MSGIAGLLQLDGSPADANLLHRITECIAFRGPDALRVWTGGPVGLSHTLLRTTHESEREQQPCSLDGQAWITADVRLDARSDLLFELRSTGCDCSGAATDSELILDAYRRWGEDCVQHFLGDFSFAIWDEPARKLFCARDHFGIKPFFYAQTSRLLLFSNDLECLRLVFGNSSEWNERWLGDFLLFDFTDDLSITAFESIRRLPPAHVLSCKNGTVSARRYWEMPLEGPTRYKHPAEYVERFRELFEAAVADRLRATRAAIFLSGGLDSSAVAAGAARVQHSQAVGCNLLAYTSVYDHLVPHDERHYARLVSEALGIPVEYQIADRYRLFERADQPEFYRPEPVHDPLAAVESDQLRQISQTARVALTGYGGDPALASFLSSHFWKLLKRFRWGTLAADLARFLSTEGRLRRLYLRTRLRRWLTPETAQDFYPPWLNEAFSKRLNLAQRWQQSFQVAPVDHPVRPEAYQLVTAPMWTALFEGYDPGATRLPVEVRHPFFDLRVLRYLLTLPAVPWCTDKELLRASLRGVLTDEVRLRRKTPLTADPITALLQQPDQHWVDSFEALPELARYVVRDRIPPVARECDSWRAWTNLRPLSLNFWLRSVTRANRLQDTKSSVGGDFSWP